MVPGLEGFTVPGLEGFTVPGLEGFTVPGLAGFRLPGLAGLAGPSVAKSCLAALGAQLEPQLELTGPSGESSASCRPFSGVGLQALGVSSVHTTALR